METKYKIEKHIADALLLIERAIKDEPHYEQYFDLVKNSLEDADNYISYSTYDYGRGKRKLRW